MAEPLDTDAAATKLRSFIGQRYLPRRQRPLTNDEALLSSGIIDSVGLVDLTVFIEEEFGVLLSPDRFGAGRADTVREVVALIARGG